MRKSRLTDVAIQSLTPLQSGQYEHFDAMLPGFGIRVSAGGTKTFFVRIKGRRRSIGRYPVVSLKEAREEGKRILFDKQGHRREQELEVTYQEAVDRYLRMKEPELRSNTLRDYTRLLGRFDFPNAVKDIKPYQVADALDQFERQTDKSHAFTVLKVFFGWCLVREYCNSNPLQNLKKPKLPPSRDRVLTDDELAAIWFACDELGKYGALVRLLMLTGQRAGQIARLQSSWLNKEQDSITFPAAVMKNKKEHFCPIGNLSRFVLLQVPMTGDYYFSPVTAVGRPFSAWSKNKAKLDRIVELDPWRLHDLRRTWSTNAGRVDIPPHITSRVLSHYSDQGKVAQIYNRYKYQGEVAEAMAKMDDHILSLIEPDTT